MLCKMHGGNDFRWGPASLMRPREPFPACRPCTGRYVRPERLALTVIAALLTRWRHQNLRVGFTMPDVGDTFSASDTTTVHRPPGAHFKREIRSAYAHH